MSIKTQHVWDSSETSRILAQDRDAARATPWQEEWSLVRVSRAKDVRMLEDIWVASQDADDADFRPHDGWWSLNNWATDSRLLLKDGIPVGVAAINVVSGEEIAEARLALLPTFRHVSKARLLLEQIQVMSQDAGKARIRLSIPAQATWAMRAVQQCNFSLVRMQHVMVRPAQIEPFPLCDIDGVRVRSLYENEELALLEALNRAWARTWNFRPIPLKALLADLKGQRNGFFVAVERTDDTHILGTVHALFDQEARNPDDQPYAWISNLTVDPAWHRQGLGRMLLTVGLSYLSKQGAGSVALGVDGGAIAPMALYRSAGFEAVSTVQIWEPGKALHV